MGPPSFWAVPPLSALSNQAPRVPPPPPPPRWIGTLILYSLHKGSFDCPGGGVLHSYLVVLLVLLALIILSLCAIIYVSAQGGGPRGRRDVSCAVMCFRVPKDLPSSTSFQAEAWALP